MVTAGSLFCKFLSGLNPSIHLPENISVINPYHNPDVTGYLKKFCDHFYNDTKKRILILGINPGRFGAGLTGIPFTDPFALDEYCGINNSIDKRRELSSVFVYNFINAFGGSSKFYETFLLSALCPIGFLKGTKNFNYYDSPELLRYTESLMKRSLIEHASMNISKMVVISLGKKNGVHLQKFNDELKLFKEVLVLEHPRFIMQYKRRLHKEYIKEYLDVLKGAMNLL